MNNAYRLPALVAGTAIWFASASALAQRSELSDPAPITVKEPQRREKVSYSREIADLLEDKCTGCHGSVLAEKGLDLESVAGMLKGGKRGQALVRGKADESLMFTMAAHRMRPVMPPLDKPANKPMTSLELGLLRLWINEGATDDSEEGAAGNEARRSIVLGELPPGVQPINAVDMTASGMRVAAGRANVVQVYDVDSGLEIVSLGGHKDLIQSVRYSPDGRFLAAGSYQIVTLWNAPSGNLRYSLAGHVGPSLSLCVAPDGLTAFSGGQDRSIRVWNLADGKLLRTLIGPVAVTAVAVVDGGKTLVSGGGDGTIRLLDGSDGRERFLLRGHTAAVVDLAVLSASPGGLRIVSASEDGTARIWTVGKSDGAGGGVKTGMKPVEEAPLVLIGHKGAVRGMSLSTDARTIVTGGDDGTVRLWGVNDGKAQGAALSAGHAGPILAVAISPDSKTILTGSSDKTARLLARSDGKLIRTLSGHNAPVRGVAFSPRGDRIATADCAGRAEGVGDGYRPGCDCVRAHCGWWGCNSAASEGGVQWCGVSCIGVGRWHAEDVEFHRDVVVAQDAGPARLPRAGARLQPGRRSPRHGRRRAIAFGGDQDVGGWKGFAGPVVAIASFGHGFLGSVQSGWRQAGDGFGGQVSQGDERGRRQTPALV